MASGFAPYRGELLMRPWPSDSAFDPCRGITHERTVLSRQSVTGLWFTAAHCIRCGEQLGDWRLTEED